VERAENEKEDHQEIIPEEDKKEGLEIPNDDKADN
jgi:hypothetical protein